MGIVTLPSFGTDPATVNAANLDGKVDPLATEFNGGIDNDNIDASAGIVYSKLSLSNSILNADINSSAAIVASKLDLSPVAQTIQMSGASIDWAKGSDIASATTTDIGAMTGNYGDVTGTTTITGLGTVQAGTFRVVRFTGALTLTHNATSLLLPTATNIATAANDTAGFVSLGSGNWKCVWYQRYSGAALAATTASGVAIQTVKTQTGATASGTTIVPLDDTIPQKTEGDEYMTLAITPSNASNVLVITVQAQMFQTNGYHVIGMICQDATADSLAAGVYEPDVSIGGYVNVFLRHTMAAGTTSATTFKFRAGPTSAGTAVFNGNGSGRILGGVCASSIVIQEIKA